MKRAGLRSTAATVLGVSLFAAILLAQSGNKLEADLLAQNGVPTARQLADDILSLAETDAQPSRRVVLDFTNDLALALVVRHRTPATIAQLSQGILGVLHSDGVPTLQYRASLDRVHKSLLAMGVPGPQAQHLVDRLKILGQQVRGPEDLPVDFPARKAPPTPK
jgi:hypothetical protein